MTDVSPHTILLKEVDFQSPVLPETRALRIPPAVYAELENLDGVLERVARAGFNLIVADVLDRGLTVYPSQVAHASRLPRARVGPRHADIVDYLCDHAARFGLAVYAGVNVLAAGSCRRFGRRTLARLRPDWLVQTRQGRHTHPDGPEPDVCFLCPTNPDVRHYIGDLLYELSESYPVEGFLLDNLRLPHRAAFPDTAFCMCQSCRDGVARDLGFDLEKIALHVSDPDFQRWTRWKSEQISQLLYSVRTRVRKARWSIRLVGAVHNTYRSGMFAHDVVCDWPAWIAENMVDAVCTTPPDSGIEPFTAAVRADISVLAAGTLYLAFLPVSDMANGCPLLVAGREVGASGFVYQCQNIPSDAMLSEVTAHFAQRAVPAEDNPIAGAVYYMTRVASLAGGESELRTESLRLLAEMEGRQDLELEHIEEYLGAFKRIEETLLRQSVAPAADVMAGMTKIVQFLEASLLL